MLPAVTGWPGTTAALHAPHLQDTVELGLRGGAAVARLPRKQHALPLQVLRLAAAHLGQQLEVALQQGLHTVNKSHETGCSDEQRRGACTPMGEVTMHAAAMSKGVG